MAEIVGWFSLKGGAHIPIMKGQSRAEAAKKYYASKHGKTVAKLSSKSNSKSSSGNAKLDEYRNMSYEDIRKLQDKLFDVDRNDVYAEGLNGGSDYQKLVRELGLNDKPTVLSKEEFDKNMKDNTVLYRGVKPVEELNFNTGRYETKLSEKDIIDNLKYSDKTYIGNGIHGDGIYFSDVKDEALKYNGFNEKAVVTAYLDKSKLRAVNKSELKEMKQKFIDDYNKNKPFYEHINMQNIESAFRDDSGFALYKGYNCVIISSDKSESNQTYYNVLDRSVLVIRGD